ncbi:M23 family metallopeptidase [Faecalispora anaeroviscerum]|uniref:M23 family metallopeptidase n=1 Tax=Faecalispora anaeroviscerum TaxID=2991836 RepID=UPI0024BB0802|nr:peptidoglycan DD-metalloendopeptidase family protein [Faecalispora anaeroviscerum]
MADPATIALAVKAAVAVATDKRTCKAIGVIIAAAFTPLILCIVVIISMLSGAADNNNAAVDLCFKGGAISSQVPADYATHIQNIQNCFSKLDTAIKDISAEIEDGSIDSVRVKAIFYSLYFGADSLNLSAEDYRNFVGYFVTHKQETNTKSGTTKTVAVPVIDLETIYASIEKKIGKAVTQEERQNAADIYKHITASQDSEVSVNGGMTSPVGSGFISPIGSNWRNLVTSDYGGRTDPIRGDEAFHTGLDLGVPIGTAVHAAINGTVKYVRYDTGGYGHHVVIDRGDGLCTLYGHCSQIVVTAGQSVKQGDLIAYSGSTGRSTGPHLHFEVDINGKSQNPRNYLP